MGKAKPGTVQYTGAPAGSRLIGSSPHNRDLLIEVFDAQEASGRRVGGGFIILDAGQGLYATLLAPLVGVRFNSAAELITMVRAQGGAKCTHIINRNCMNVIDRPIDDDLSPAMPAPAISTVRRDIKGVDSTHVAANRSGRNLISVIGIDYYRHTQYWQPLSHAVSDARGAAAVFERLGFVNALPSLLDEAATGEAIQSLVTDDLTTLGSDDSLVLFYAGHGGNRKHRVGDHEVTTAYLIPVDGKGRVATWVELEAWLRAVALLPAKHILVILDACHSGFALDPLIKWRDSTSFRGEPLATLSARRSRRIITSALGDQRAMDGGPYPGHSLFTGCLIEALTHGLRGTDEPMTTGSELGLCLQRRVGSYPHTQQTPDFGTFAFDDRGEMVITLPVGRRAEPLQASSVLVEFTTQVAQVRFPPTPSISASAILITPDDREIYVVDEERGRIAVIENMPHDGGGLKTKTTIDLNRSGSAAHPQRLALNPRTNVLYVTDPLSDEIIVVDRRYNNEIAGRIPVGRLPRSIVFSPEGNKAYVSNEGPIPQGTLSVIDARRHRVVATLSGVNTPEGLALDPGHRRLYVASQSGYGEDPVFVVDTSKDEVVEEETIVGMAVGVAVAVSPRARKLYVARGNYLVHDSVTDRRGSPLSIVDLESRHEIRTHVLETSVNLAVLTPDERHVLVGNGEVVTVVDTETDEVIRTFGFGAAPLGIAVSRSGAVYVLLPGGDIKLVGLSGLLRRKG
jgi:YVTN family beta-propeller protein